jgi:catechol 2,3-dioxygenase-like lactoylglutathione lyase family enzyme
MITRLSVTSIYVLDKEEALDFYVAKLGLEKGNDVQQGDYRWLTVRVPGDPSTEISLEQPGPGSLWQQHPDPPAGEVASAGCPSSCT